MPNLFDAYHRSTFFVVARTERIGIRTDRMNNELDDLLRNEGVAGWAYITACNPGSKCLSDAENTTRMGLLRRELSANDYKFYEGEGRSNDGNWPPEPSVLVLGIALNDALVLGGKFGQLAIVAGTIGQPARLVWCSDGCRVIATGVAKHA